MENKFDIIMIGAGLGGLTAGSVLAKTGKKILIVEMHDKVGGFATCFQRKNFKFDVSLHNFGPLFEYQIINKIFNELELLNEIKYINFEEYQRLIFPKHDFVIKKGLDNFINFLKKEFPDEINGIDSFFEIMKNIKEEFDDTQNVDVTLDHLEEVYPMLPMKFPNIIKYAQTTLGELLDKFIKNFELRGIIANLWWMYGMHPYNLAGIIFSIPTYNYYNFSGGIFEGTSQSLSDAFAKKINEYGGKILLNSKVKKIIIDSNKAVGVLLENGESIYADIVVSNVNPYETFINMIDKEYLKERFRKKVENFDLSLSAIQLYLGLDCTPTQLGMKNHNINVFESYDHLQNYQWIMDGCYEKTIYSCTDYTAFDKSLAPSGKGIMSILSPENIKNWDNLTENQYREKKKAVTDIIIKKVEKQIPGLSNHLEIVELGTPITMKRYTMASNGAIYGISQIIEQTGLSRLTPETPIEKLYIVGANIYPGAGYSTVISSGYKTARLIINKENTK